MKHDDEESKEAHVVLFVIRLPHTGFQISRAIRVEVSDGSRSGRRVNENDVANQKGNNCANDHDPLAVPAHV
jgi:hypothetical protein